MNYKNGPILSMMVLLTLVTIGLSMSACEESRMLIVAVVAGVGVVIASIVWVADRMHHQEPMLLSLLVPVLFLGTIISVGDTEWPLRLAYSLSRAKMDAVAAELRAGTTQPGPRWIGMFQIESAEVNSFGVVCFWTRVAYGGNTGFVQCPPDHVRFNLWSIIRLDDHWQFISED